MATMRQNRGRATLIARGRMHRAKAVELSEFGVSKVGAAERIGLTVGGLNTLLHREFGTEVWPIKGHGPEARSA